MNNFEKRLQAELDKLSERPEFPAYDDGQLAGFDAGARWATESTNPMTEKEFLDLYSQYCGERVDNLGQIVSHTFSGEELFEFCKYLEDIIVDGVSPNK